MQRIRREKTGAVHYATGVAAPGNITGWTADVTLAVMVPACVKEQVQSFYASVRNAGTLTFEPEIVPVPEPQPEASPVVVEPAEQPIESDLWSQPNHDVAESQPQPEAAKAASRKARRYKGD